MMNVIGRESQTTVECVFPWNGHAVGVGRERERDLWFAFVLALIS
jgi:hypothetical protein